jgi:hypothetical protein
MSYCDHCSGQRFDRAQVLRTLRGLRRTLEIPHLEVEPEDSEVVH